mgnify:FL=1
MTIDELLPALGQELGLSGLVLDENGTCAIAFDDLALTFETLPDRSRAVVHAALGPALLAADARALFAEALSANYFGRKTGGAVLALDDMKGELVLWRDIVSEHYQVVGEFIRDLERFLEAARSWGDRLREVSRLPDDVKSTVPLAPQVPLPGTFA